MVNGIPRLVANAWPAYWLEWDAAVSFAASLLGMSRRSVAAHARGLIVAGVIERATFVEARGDRRAALLTRRAPPGKS
jgi:hypothetical protein